MKKFVLLDLQNTDVRDEYEGEFLENSTYRFTSTKNPENSIEVVLIEKDKASFVRHTPEFCLSGTLKKNNVVNLDLVTKGLLEYQNGSYHLSSEGAKHGNYVFSQFIRE